MRLNISIIIVLTALLSIAGCSGRKYIQINGYAQGSVYTIKCDLPPSQAEEAGKDIEDILGTIDRAVSGYNPNSLICRWNRGEMLTDDGSQEYDIFLELMNFGDSLYLATKGVLDVRAASLFDVWGFGFRENEFPERKDVEKAMADRGKLNFNAIAQGYSADKVAEYLKGLGVRNMLVNVGGEIFCCGVNPKGKPWKIGIDSPIDGNNNPGRNMSGKFTVEGHPGYGVVTSGNYRKFFIHDGVKYSHSIDPRTGYPVQHNLLSATVIASTSALADAMATCCMVLGFEKASEMIASESGLEGCLITSDSLWHSPGFIMEQ